MIKLKYGIEVEEDSWMNPLIDLARLRKYRYIKKAPLLETELLRLLAGGEVNLSELSRWSIKVKERDKECLVCGIKENLNAHHMIYKSTMPQLQYNMNNGISLCKDHHAECHLGETCYNLIKS